MSNLQPKQFFHGTVNPIAVGDKVISAAAQGHEGNYPNATTYARQSRVYVTTDENEAWKWANQTLGQQRRHGGDIPEAERSPRVYRVKPDRPRAQKSDISGEHSTHEAEVLEEYHAPISEQAQIPGVNWAAYKQPKDVDVSRAEYARVNRTTPTY
jgi:hypothetical protein